MLVLTRTEGAVTYGGRSLTANLEETFDHLIRIDRIVDTAEQRYADIGITKRDGEERIYRLDQKKNSVSLDSRAKLVLVNVAAVISRDGRLTPIVRIGFDAPKSYRIVRDDAIKKAK